MLRYSTRLLYFVCLIFVSSASFATITFEGSLGVKQALSSCTGCHYGADAPDACLNTDDQGGVATGWYHNDGSDAEQYDSASACRPAIQKRTDHTTSQANNYVYMPQISTCDPGNDFDPGGRDTSGCLSGNDFTVVQGWGGTRWAKPVVATSANDTKDNTSATLKGTVDMNGSAAVTNGTKFLWGTNSALAGASTKTVTNPSDSGGNNTAVNMTNGSLTGLACNKKYYFRASVQNGRGTDNGNILNFTTDACSAPVINVNGSANNGPININLSKGQTLSNADLLITATDADHTSTLDWSISSPATTGAITDPLVAGVATTTSTNTANPTISYTAPLLVPTDPVVTFTVQVEDETSATTLKDTIVINVTIVDNAPIIDQGANMNFLVTEDSMNNILQLTGTDLDGDALTWTTESSPAGTYSGVQNADDTKFDITYTPVPDTDITNATSFTVRVTDGVGFFEIVVSVDITAQPDDPVANSDPSYTVLVNSTNNTLDVLANDSDVDTLDTITLATQVIVGSNGGAITVNSAGTINNDINYTPLADAVVTETFTYTVTDSTGRTDTALVTVSPPDTDGDGVFDYIDNCAATQNGPLGGSDNQVDNDGDEVINVNTISNPVDPLVGGDACDTDDDNDGMLDVDELLYPTCLDKDNAADATEDCDGDGLDNITEINDGNPDTVPDVDSVGPTVNAPADITIDATGLLTIVNLGTATGNDGNDGEVTIIKAAVNLDAGQIAALEAQTTGCELLATYETDIEPFAPGMHVVTWASCDSKGNSGHDEQTVNVKPLVSVSAGQSVGEGRSVSIDVVLNGEAIDYPASVQYSLTGTATELDDHDGSSGLVTFSGPGDVGIISFNTAADGVTEGDETVLVTLFAPTNIALGKTKMHTVTITEDNIAPQVELDATQGANAIGNTIYKLDGTAIIVASANDGNGDTLSFDWSATNSVLLAASTVSANRIDIDASDVTLISGDFYNVSVTVSDGNLPVTIERLILVKTAEVVVLSAVDSDGDGFNDDDASEGFADDDADGIPNYLDDRFAPSNVIESHSVTLESSALVETNPGLRIVKGETAVASLVDGIVIGMQDLVAHGGPGGTAVSNADTEHTFLSSLINFEVHGLTDAIESVHVVVPLSSSLQADAVFRKYSSSGWFDFVIDDKNEIASAVGEDGACPQPGSNSYSAGLTAGHLCVQLTIQDGGANDADGVRNFIVKDPGGLALAPELEEVASSSDSGRVGSVSLWFMLLLSITAVAVWHLRMRKLVRIKNRHEINR